VVATISARKSVKSAVAYYQHMGADSYYTRETEAPGRWEGRGAERLSLEGPVAKSEFEAALNGVDPKTGERLVQANGRAHSAGWDMTFSAPKSVSVMWALSPENERKIIEAAHRKAVKTAATYLENEAAWARRGRGGAIREKTAGLLMAQFDHHTSRDLDPQLHTHAFVFNLAPRGDGSWGAIVSRELYKAQKEAGRIFRAEFARELERDGFAIERDGDNFRLKAIPKHVARAFSKRRESIEKAAELYGYSSPKGMEKAALRTRKTKQSMQRDALFEAWRDEAKTLGFEPKKENIRSAQTPDLSGERSKLATHQSSIPAKSSAVISRQNAQSQRPKTRVATPSVRQLLQRLTNALNSHSRMTGIKISLRERRRSLERD